MELIIAITIIWLMWKIVKNLVSLAFKAAILVIAVGILVN